MVLLAGLSAFAFAETYYSYSVGLFRFNEHFLENDNGNELNGISVNFDINTYLGEFPLGWFIHASAGAAFDGFEWTEDSITKIDDFIKSDLRLSFGPSYKIALGSKLAIPLSFGPTVAHYRIETYEYCQLVDFSETINMGLYADASVMLIPFRWFFMKAGVSASWDCIRLERDGMRMSFRNANTIEEQIKDMKYSAYNFTIYCGFGLRF